MIYYSHVNEDSVIEHKLLADTKSFSCICIAGSGERFISILDVDTCKEFICIDIYQPALFLTKLKLVFLKYFSVKEYLNIIGYNTCTKEERLLAFDSIAQYLDSETLTFWKKHEKWIGKGVLHCGAFERFLSRARPMLRILLRKKFYQLAYQHESFSPLFLSWRWKLLKKMFGFKIVYRLLGNHDSAFIGKAAKPSFIPNTLDLQFKNGTAKYSFIYHLIFQGHFHKMDSSVIPISLQVEILEKIKKRLADDSLQVSFIHQDLLEYLTAQCQEAKSNFISTSDILSFVPVEYLEKLLNLPIARMSTIAVRAFIKNRITEKHLSQIKSKGFCYSDWSGAERSGMYQVFSLSANE